MCALPALMHSTRRHPPSARAARHTARAPTWLHYTAVPLRVAITRTSKYARTVPVLAKSPEPLLSWVALWLWPCPSTKHVLLTFQLLDSYLYTVG
jgi:hypothetical protein